MYPSGPCTRTRPSRPSAVRHCAFGRARWPRSEPLAPRDRSYRNGIIETVRPSSPTDLAAAPVRAFRPVQGGVDVPAGAVHQDGALAPVGGPPLRVRPREVAKKRAVGAARSVVQERDHRNGEAVITDRSRGANGSLLG